MVLDMGHAGPPQFPGGINCALDFGVGDSAVDFIDEVSGQDGELRGSGAKGFVSGFGW